ncbi:4495_t:CDS:2, partial [Cetraspora pellucida]
KLIEKANDKMTDLKIISDKAIDKTTDKATDVIINKATDLVIDMRMDKAIISNDDTELEIGYKLIIKTAEVSLLLAKWFKKSLLTVDKFLLSIHNKIIMLTKDITLIPTDYTIIFKTLRETGVGTQLANTQDFLKFKANCLKLATKNIDIEIYITITQTIKQKKNKKNLNTKEFTTFELVALNPNNI